MSLANSSWIRGDEWEDYREEYYPEQYYPEEEYPDEYLEETEAPEGSPDSSTSPTSGGLLPNTIPERPSPLSISTTASEFPKRPVPGPLDLSSAQANRSAASSSPTLLQTKYSQTRPDGGAGGVSGPKSTKRTQRQRELVDRKVRPLLDKLRINNVDFTSDQIVNWANTSEEAMTGSALMQVVALIFEKARGEADSSEMCARLCKKTMERVSPNLQDEGMWNANGRPTTGGLVFRKYLLNQVQEDLERGWSAKGDAEAVEQGSGEAVVCSDEHDVAAKANQQCLRFVRFLGELFKLKMLTGRIMHNCIKKLLSNLPNPNEEEIESLCGLLRMVGPNLDTRKGKILMDNYFDRISETAKQRNVNSRVQLMLQDVIELRLRHWQPFPALARPSTVALAGRSSPNTDATAFIPGQSHIYPRATYIRTSTPDASAVSFESAVIPSSKIPAGVGQGSAPPPVLQKRQSAVINIESDTERAARLAEEKEEKEERERLRREAKGKGREDRGEREEREQREKERTKREERERVERESKARDQERKEREEKERKEREERERVERAQAEIEAMDKANVERAKLKAEAKVNVQDGRLATHETISLQTSRRRSLDRQFHQNITHTESFLPATRQDLNNFGSHQPITENEDEAGIFNRITTVSSQDDAEWLVVECLEVCLRVENIERAIAVLQDLPNDYRYLFVEKSIAAVFNDGIRSFPFFERLFTRVYAERICAPKSIERGFLPAIESADETSMDLPRTYEWLARLMHAVGLTKARVDRMAERIVVAGEPKLHPRYLLVYEYEKLLYR